VSARELPTTNHNPTTNRLTNHTDHTTPEPTTIKTTASINQSNQSKQSNVIIGCIVDRESTNQPTTNKQGIAQTMADRAKGRRGRSSSPPRDGGGSSGRRVRRDVAAKDLSINDAGVKVLSSFDQMGLKEDLLRGIYTYGFEKPSAIQQVKCFVWCNPWLRPVARSHAFTGAQYLFIRVSSNCRVMGTQRHSLVFACVCCND
jgi:hypothetical protein